MLAAILTCSLPTPMLTSCADTVDNPAKPPLPSAVTLADVQDAMEGVNIDISPYVLGDETIDFWELYEDNTFTLYSVSNNEYGEELVDTVSGTWKPFIEEQNPWDEEGVMTGFEATFRSEFYGPEDSQTTRYYAFDVSEDGEEEDLLFLSDDAIFELLKTYENESDGARTRAKKVGSKSPKKAMKKLGKAVRSEKAELKKKKKLKLIEKEELVTRKKRALKKLKKAGQPSDPLYNINAKEFTRAEWRNCQEIFLYTGTGSEVDENGEAGYTIEQLPWASVSESNLPKGFCDNIIPAYGWDLVLNLCGTRNENMNYFALYNKYTGILRFFTFVPRNFNVNSGNDHNWEINISNDLAQRMQLKYALPIDNKIVNKQSIGQTGSRITMFSSPWVDHTSADGHITPRQGWWAFDVDLSLYRPEVLPIDEDIRVNMCSWANDKVTLTSEVQKVVPIPSAGSRLLNSLTGLVGQITGLGDPLKAIIDAVDDEKETDFKTTAKSLFSLGKGAYSIYQGLYDAVENAQAMGKPEANYRMVLSEKINTEGLISGARAVAGVSAPSIKFTEFDLDNTTLGQGVWNLKSSPVVYQTNYRYGYRSTIPVPGIPTPAIYWDNSLRNYDGYMCFFDPSSVEVVLNPNVLPKDKIEYMEMHAICGVRSKLAYDATDDYRTAFGIGAKEASAYKQDATYTPAVPSLTYDYFWNMKEYQEGTEFKQVSYKAPGEGENDQYLLVGRGDNDYVYEPQFIRSYESVFGAMGLRDKCAKYLPAYEVTVTLAVKLKGVKEPLFFSRIYLPEVRQFDIEHDMQKTAAYMDGYLKQQQEGLYKGHTAWLEYQVKRVKEVFTSIKDHYMNEQDFYLSGSGLQASLFDNNYSTGWSSPTSMKSRDGWEIDFKSSKAVTPKNYSLVTGGDITEHPKRNPKEWSLYAKASNGKWVKLDSRNTEKSSADALPTKSYTKKTYTIQSPGTEVYTDFKLIISSHWGDELPNLGLFGMVIGQSKEFSVALSQIEFGL